MRYYKRHFLTVRSKESGYQPAFPLQMLSSEKLWPYSASDCGKILRTLNTGGVQIGDVRLEGKHASQWKPKEDYWKDYGWIVVRHTVKP